MKLEDLLRLVEDDDDGLLQVKQPAAFKPLGDDARLLESFKEIEDFYAANGREPGPSETSVHEYRLCNRLAAIRTSPEKLEKLRPFDSRELLGKPVSSIDDIFADDSMGLLDDGAEDIFKMKHVPTDVDLPDRIAKRKPCKDFAEFELLFKQCQVELVAGVRESRKFTGEQQIKEGHFFIVHGVMVYVAHVGAPERIAKNGKMNARLRCIYQNGTESDILLRSLARELYRDDAGRRILDSRDKALEALEGITDEDKPSGYIYILKSLSENPEIAGIDHLYKIGFTTGSVQDRIKNAAHEATYLMAPVKAVMAFQCYNMNTQKFEHLIHTFFGNHCLNVEVIDAKGQKAVPKEWFIAPIQAIELAVQLLINGEIVHYRYDGDKQEVVLR
ncbi:T5orf172 domain protein [Caballeronia peredens]|nr:T5orf172 domain protein [Caballeronia peredens]